MHSRFNLEDNCLLKVTSFCNKVHSRIPKQNINLPRLGLDFLFENNQVFSYEIVFKEPRLGFMDGKQLPVSIHFPKSSGLCVMQLVDGFDIEK